MSDLEFEDRTNNMPTFKSREILGESHSPGMVNFVMRIFHVKNSETATKILVICSIIFFISSFIIFYFALQ